MVRKKQGTKLVSNISNVRRKKLQKKRKITTSKKKTKSTGKATASKKSIKKVMKKVQNPPKYKNKAIDSYEDLKIKDFMSNGKRKVENEDEYYDYEIKKPVKKVKTENAPSKVIKWRTLEHQGPVFAPPYERVPKTVKFYYSGKHIPLSAPAEEVAGFYGKMLDNEFTSKAVFNYNFLKDWRMVMAPKERGIIKNLSKCDFSDFHAYYKQKSEDRKNMSEKEKLAIARENEKLTEKYGYCIMDGQREKLGNFRIEPPGIFRARGVHPKIGRLKRRVEAEDVSINIGEDAEVPKPPAGHNWKEVVHDNTVLWLAKWTDNIRGSKKYIMLNSSSRQNCAKDCKKYETARELKEHVDEIRAEYRRDFDSKDMGVKQRAVALYFIDELSLRAGNEKDEHTADTVGCCSLRVEHITLDEKLSGKKYVVSFDFLGKDSIRYLKSVPVEKKVFKNLNLFVKDKRPGDHLFDSLSTTILNKYLNGLMRGLTAKVFRTYNASKTFEEELDELTQEDMSLPEKLLAYNRANRAVAVLCNHIKAVSKGFMKSMGTLIAKKLAKIEQIIECKKDLKRAAKRNGSAKEKDQLEKIRERLEKLEEQLEKLEEKANEKEENKEIALGTSKLNYLDPRISVAWCKKWDVPIEKIYSKTQRDKFKWAIETTGPHFKF